ncbi:hypothetical protein QUA71_17555 [Microcoleus sp. MON1_C5]|uniref:hypothetical protein n=1 Tax=Microcoleus sp. MON1_C5 TaxID=2818828 RepID=UPI002FD2FE01
MPVAQERNFIVQQARKRNRQDACSTRDEFYCGTGILPVHKRLWRMVQHMKGNGGGEEGKGFNRFNGGGEEVRGNMKQGNYLSENWVENPVLLGRLCSIV